jgi:hypothetical protein
MLHFGSASKNWNQLLCAPLARTHSLLLRPLMMQLAEMKDQVEADDIVTLLSKVVDVQLPESLPLCRLTTT